MPTDNISRGIIEFVESHLDSFVTWDVLIYFHENTHVERKTSTIALEVGRRVDDLEPVLESLALRGVLKVDREPEGEASYLYAPGSEFRTSMELFIESSRDRANRLEFVSRVLKKEAKRL